MIRYQSVTKSSTTLFKCCYKNFINGKWLDPIEDKYCKIFSAINKDNFYFIARSTKLDIAKAVDSASIASKKWAVTPIKDRSCLLLEIAKKIEANRDLLALAEACGSGKAVKDTLTRDLPLCIDHLHFCAKTFQIQHTGSITVNSNIVSYHIHKPLGIIGQILPADSPLLVFIWSIAPAIVAGNCVIVKPSEKNPLAILTLITIIQDIIPAGVINIVNGTGIEAGKALATNISIAKVIFSGTDEIGSRILEYCEHNNTPTIVKLSGKHSCIYFEDILNQKDDFIEHSINSFIFTLFNSKSTNHPQIMIASKIFDIFILMVISKIRHLRRGKITHKNTIISDTFSTNDIRMVTDSLRENLIKFRKAQTNKNKDDHSNLTSFDITLPQHNKISHNKKSPKNMITLSIFQNEEEAYFRAYSNKYVLGSEIWTRDFALMFRLGNAIKAGNIWDHLYPTKNPKSYGDIYNNANQPSDFIKKIDIENINN